jgi:hypothetical protein
LQTLLQALTLAPMTPNQWYLLIRLPMVQT